MFHAFSVIIVLCLVVLIQGHVGLEKCNASELATRVDNMRSAMNDSLESYLQKSYIIYGLMSLAEEQKLSADCYAHLKHIKSALTRKEPWAMKVLDASGTKHAGFMFGENFWLGSRKTCDTLQKPIKMRLTKLFKRLNHDGITTQVAPFSMRYSVVYLRHNSPWQLEVKLDYGQFIHVGLCVPRACSVRELEQLTAEYVQSEHFAEKALYDMQPALVYAKDLELSESFYARQTLQMLLAIVSFTLVMMLGAAVMGSRSAHSEGQSDALRKISSTIFGKIVNAFKSFILCFDLRANCKRMFALKDQSTDIPLIDGLRGVFAPLIVILHTVWCLYNINNVSFVYKYLENITMLAITVDIFFTISGFCRVFNLLSDVKLLEEMRQNNLFQNIKLFLEMLLHRYLRLTPLCIMMMITTDLFYAYIDDVSVYHINERFHDSCAQHWWRNLLFIQSFYDQREICVNWTWSLSCEMQYFILATILIFIYVRNQKLAYSLTALLLFANIAWSFYRGIQHDYTFSLESNFSAGSDIYMNPLVRIQPYIVGAIAGWLLAKQRARIRLKVVKRYLGIAFCLVSIALGIFMADDGDLIGLPTIFFFVSARLCISLLISCLIFASALDSPTWYTRMFEAKFFQHLNRVTYAIYLFNPLVIVFFVSLTSVSTQADAFMLLLSTIGFEVMIYLLSIVFSLGFEMPYCNLSANIKRSNVVKKGD